MQNTDVIVVGSGAGGMLAAIRAHDLGLKAILIEKSDRYGGTSAQSGGAIWIPNNHSSHPGDSYEAGLAYLKTVTEGAVPDAKLARYAEVSVQMPAYLSSLGVHYYVDPPLTAPDYYPSAPGASPGGRTMCVKPMDGAVLGEEFFRLREQQPQHKLLEKISIDIPEGIQLSNRRKGWIKTLVRIFAQYFGNRAWRRRTHRDQRLTLGNALIGGLRKAMLDRGIPLLLKTGLTRLVVENGRVVGIVAEREGNDIHLSAARAVILASGGFEQSQPLRDRYFEHTTRPDWSATPPGNNTGDGLTAAMAIGADTEFMNEAWWAPTVKMGSNYPPHTVRSVPLFFERGFPHSLAVNRVGKRFVNEICSYHLFGQAMIKDQTATQANLPCWLVFDATFRQKYPLGALLPGSMVPDKKLPPDWFDHLIYKADSLAALAEKIDVPVATFQDTVARFNDNALKGIDPDFGRGTNRYNLYFGDPSHLPCRVLGPVATAPFYAVRIDLGDIGSKGGPKTDTEARVLHTNGQPIPGLYAVGNAAGSVMGCAYPGPGATLGSAMTFAYLAATDSAR